MNSRLKDLVSDYGPVALTVYLVLALVVGLGALAAIEWGLELDGVAGNAGTLVMVWGFLKLTQPIRIAVTVGLTPVAARLFKTRAPAADEAPASPSPDPEGAAGEPAGDLADAASPTVEG